MPQRHLRPILPPSLIPMPALMPTLALVLMLVLLGGCASVPQDYPRSDSSAFAQPLDTDLGQFFAPAAAHHPGQSGFAIIREGRRAFTARIMLTELAERSLDLQYYVWEDDATGYLLAQRVIQAADRGVRVRMLLDDLNLGDRDQLGVAMDAHPNIEIRIFNPFAHRSTHLLDLPDMARVNHRMHNKTLVADNAVAILGGRNIGNHYFGVATDANFRDLDVAVVGPLVDDVSTVFDHFWNGPWAVPIGALVSADDAKAAADGAEHALQPHAPGEQYPHPLEQDSAALQASLNSFRDRLIWADGRIVWDDPDAIQAIDEQRQRGKIISALYRKLDTLERELLVESAYFVLLDPSLQAIEALTARGVRVRILTNSLASNDVLAAHAGHAKRRPQLLAAGVELHELRPDSAIIKHDAHHGESRAALHTKTLVFDRESVFIGSFNLDPRSANINTEVGLYIESPALAAEVAAYLDTGVRPENSYRVTLDDDGDVIWSTLIDGEQVEYTTEPASSWWQRTKSRLIQMLPLDRQL